MVATIRNPVLSNPHFQTLRDINFNGCDLTFQEDQSILKLDTGADDPNRLLVFSTSTLVEYARTCNRFQMDGTFSLAPSIYNNGTTNRCGQVFSIHAARQRGGQVPIFYALMARRTEREYVRLFEFVRTLIPAENFKHVMLIMERASSEAIKSMLANRHL